MNGLRKNGATGEVRPRVLRIGVINDGRFIEERLLAPGEPVTVGTSPECTIVLPHKDRSGVATLLRPRGDHYELCFGSDTEGRLASAAGPRSLRSLAADTRTRRGRGGVYRYPLPERARGKVRVGDVTVLFQMIEAPVPVPRPVLPSALRGGFGSRPDWSFLSLVLVILAIQIPFVAHLHRVPIPRAVSWENLDSRFRTILLDEPADDAVADLNDDDAATDEDADDDADDGAAAADRPEETVALSGPRKPVSAEERARLAAEARARILDAADSKGVIGVIGSLTTGDGSGDAVRDVMSGGSTTGDMDEALARLGGVDVASSETAGGIPGDGRPGDGAGDIADLAAGGSDLSVGPVGSADAGSKTERVVERVVSTGPVDVPPGSGLEPAVVAGVVKRRLSGVVACYERGVKARHDLSGKITIRWTIGLTGRVIASRTETVHDGLGSKAVTDCVVDRINGWRFPEPDGEEVVVQFPFIFTASG